MPRRMSEIAASYRDARLAPSHTNPVLVSLRRAARVLGKPQSVVARNWVKTGMTTRSWSAARNVGITRPQHVAGMALVERLAALAE